MAKPVTNELIFLWWNICGMLSCICYNNKIGTWTHQLTVRTNVCSLNYLLMISLGVKQGRVHSSQLFEYVNYLSATQREYLGRRRWSHPGFVRTDESFISHCCRSKKTSSDLIRERLEGRLQTVCIDCREMVLQVIRAQTTARRLQMAKSFFQNLKC